MGTRAPDAPRKARHPVLIRLLLGPLVLAVVLGVIAVHDRTGSAVPTDLLMAALAALAAAEMAALLRATGRSVDANAWGWAALLAAVGLFAPDDPSARWLLRTTFVAAAFTVVMVRRLLDLRPEAVDEIARSMLPVLYVGLLLSALRDVADGPLGARRLVFVVLVAKASDIGGWLVGKPFGRHKLIPRVSPGKSWEGLAGGLALSVLVAVLLPGLLGLDEARWSVLHRALFGLAVGAAAVFGGITQSAWKRRLGAKDSSHLIPEMGGILDMIDSLLFAGWVAVLLLTSSRTGT